MADILIMGMEMPKNGRITIQIGSDGAIYTVGDCKITKEKYEKDYILLEVPDHGRLIDADKLKAYWEPDHNRYFDADNFIHTIECAPAVIPASEEK